MAGKAKRKLTEAGVRQISNPANMHETTKEGSNYTEPKERPPMDRAMKIEHARFQG